MRLKCACGNTIVERVGAFWHVSHRGRELVFEGGDLKAGRCEECKRELREVPDPPTAAAVWEERRPAQPHS